MSIKQELETILFEMEQIAQLFKVDSFDIYFLGGSACILGGYTIRSTRDFDFIDLEYSSKLGKVFTHLRDFDMLEYESTILSPTYKDRATRLDQYNYLNIFVLSKEDIIVSKIIRMAEKDLEDMDILMKTANKETINQIIEEVIQREDLFESKLLAFKKNLPVFKERYNV